ncbi:hypothetical protein SAMN05661096_00367 [Marivirga sericea]|uniref:Uncharacterized protein n=1 Tax=Marivirga sericea TaxID=1028 RepID=A0A1X7IA43_9BACT|nr:hypothetical protein [Marivirga sericea]SMG10982.1 hypothetical protein SAMN05661096_00367 [Marivirga sericea]
MTENLEQLAAQWHSFLQDYFQRLIAQKREFLTAHFEFVSLQKPVQTEESNFKADDEYKQAIFEFIKNTYSERPNLQQSDFEVLHASLITEFRNLQTSVPDVTVKQQISNRFQLLKEDRFRLKVQKPFKIFIFHLSKLPFYFINLFRKQKKPLKYWKHEINVKQLFERHFFNGFQDFISELNQSILKEFTASLVKLKDYEDLPTEEISTDSESFDVGFNPDFVKAIKTKINDEYLELCKSFEEEYDLAGTIELKDKLLSSQRLKNDFKQLKKQFSRKNHQWNNTIHALFEDWRSELELSALQSFVNKSIDELNTNVGEWNSKLQSNFINSIKSFLAEAQSTFNEGGSEEEDISKKITQVKYITNKQLDKGLLQKLQESLSKNTILNQMDRLEHLIGERIEKLASDYAVTKSNHFDKPLEDSELSSISNYELLSFELKPKLNQQLETLKSNIFQKMGDILIKVGDIDEIVNYVLSAASNSLSSEANVSQARSIIVDGFERAENTAQEADVQIQEVIKNAQHELKVMSEELIKELQGLKQNENVSAIKLRINKAKAIQKSEALTQQGLDFVKKYFEVAKKFTLVYYQKAWELKEELSKRFLSATIENEPNRAVSDFLNESNQVIDGLPVIYKRLYAIEPLTDMVLFEGRESEIEKLSTAYLAWSGGKYASVLITAEKWSGMTSLINYAVKNIKFNSVPLRTEFKVNDPDPQALFQGLSDLLETKLMDKQAIIDFLNSGRKRVIIFENLQKLFLREMHGQKALIEFIDIMTATQSNVFWIGTMSIYTFEYLERSLKMSAFFSYHIPLEPLSDTEISQLIIKRNRISGFRIKFEAVERDSSDKKFKKLNDAERQQYLKERFFKDLNNFAKSNISMALMFWLLSTKKVDDQTIIIKSFKKPDLSFLASLKNDRVFVLQALIMHDGLKLEQVAKVLSYSVTKAKFLLLELLEDGVLIEKETQYLVNPIIYRNTVQLLKSRNLL